jgi:hypothetical protein
MMSWAELCPDKGLGMGVVVRNVVVDGGGELGQLLKTPRRIRSAVIFPNQRSTRWSHEDEVGIKWR